MTYSRRPGVEDGSVLVGEIEARLDAELVAWFCEDIDEGDAPELHIVGLQANDLGRLFAAIVERQPTWSRRTFWVKSLDADVSISERPDVADLVVSGDAPWVCLGASRMEVEGVSLPLIEMFLLPDEIEFFWWPPDAEWSPTTVAAFLLLVRELMLLAPAAELQPDPRYHVDTRRRLAQHLRLALGEEVKLRI